MDSFKLNQLGAALMTLTMLAACSGEESASPNVPSAEIGIRSLPTGETFTFVCNDDPSDVLSVRYFTSEPSRMRAERQGEAIDLTVAPSGSGARYANGTTSYWEHQGEVTLEWGNPPTTATCKPQ